ncbi:MAG: DEAD/DEAH box helicase [Candidatus Sumerlaeota bacterium]|nr:DEAD/DEAH box helicase [Candidatus Sumerlaeota bacterium]
MIEIRLTPSGRLQWEASEEASESARLAHLRDCFMADWREGIFRLGAEKVAPGDSLALRYWQGIAERFVAGLCHLPGGMTPAQQPPPTEAECAQWILTAPPMQGGEYLSQETLRSIWNALVAWCAEASQAAGGLGAFLEARAPQWRQVGRVCFHLAENKADPARPFAFMATFVSGLGASGQARHLPLRQALEQYAGANNRPALVKLLSPVQAAAERLEWVKEMVESGEIYRPMAWTPPRAYRFLLGVSAMEESGLTVRLPDWWRRRPRPQVSVTIGSKKPSMLGLEAMLDFNVQVALGDMTLTAEDIKALMEGGDGLVLLKGQWVEVDREKLQEAIEHWQTLRRKAREGGVSFIEGMRLLAGASEDLKHEEQTEAVRAWAHVEAGEAMREILAALRDPARLEANDSESGSSGESGERGSDGDGDGGSDEDGCGGLRAILRPYQRHGVSWLRLLTGLGLGACLADDMGLGKTIQVLALLLRERLLKGNTDRHRQAQTDTDPAPQTPSPAPQKPSPEPQTPKPEPRTPSPEPQAPNPEPRTPIPGEGPALLIVPASLLGNWRAEADKFAPALRLVFLHPAEASREELERIEQSPREQLASCDLAITTYSMLARQQWLTQIEWRMVILDEAQAIKNPGTGQTRAVKKLPARARVALTGTPVENRLGDLWSIFDFLNPGLLGSSAVFKSFITGMEKRPDASGQFAPLRRLVAPYILRRMKTDRSVIADLPDKVETTRFCNLTKTQVRLYEQVVDAMKTALQDSDGMKRRALVLQTLMRLKQVCNHPSQLTGDGVYDAEDSGKFQRLAEICEELAERQERVLVFTQFREIIDPLSARLTAVFGRSGLVLHGDTSVPKRRGLVEQFQREDGPPFFILSLKAGGTGLNLTAASHVIHFDRWWNPAVEDQATDRAFRIGQRKNVLVHKFVTSGSVEERIDAMIAQKRKMAGEILGGEGEVDVTSLSDEALLSLVRLDITRAAM